jgi:hypothetical protein
VIKVYAVHGCSTKTTFKEKQMNQRKMVIAFINASGLILGVPFIIAGIFSRGGAASSIIYGGFVLALLFIVNTYFYHTSGSRVVGKHFARYWLLYGFFLGMATTGIVLGFATIDGRSPHVVSDKLLFPLKVWEFNAMWLSSVLGSYCLGVYHTMGTADEKIARLLKNAGSAEEIVRGLKYGKLDRPPSPHGTAQPVTRVRY